MPASLRDNVLVSYQVQSEERGIVLQTERRDVEPVEVTRVVFTGVEGYHFRGDTFGSILSDVLTVPMEEILAEHGAEIAEPDVLRGRGVQGFVLSSSHGMTGWVLARSAAIVAEPRPLAPPPADTRGIYALAADGARPRVDGDGLVVAFGDGRELVIRPSRQPRRDGCVVLRSRFVGPGGESALPTPGDRPDTYAYIVVHPGGGNVMAVDVEAWSVVRRAIVVPGASRACTPSGGPAKSYFVTRGEERSPIESAGFLIDLGEGRVLNVDRHEDATRPGSVRFYAGPMGTKGEWERLRAGGPLEICRLSVWFGGGNVVDVRVGRPHSAHPIRRPSPRTGS